MTPDSDILGEFGSVNAIAIIKAGKAYVAI